MSYENQTYEDILSRMIARIEADYPNLDTREGSLIYTALAPAALELSNMYYELDMVLNEAFADTATKEYLIRHCDQMGLEMQEGTNATFNVETNVALELDQRFSMRNTDFTYSVIEANDSILEGETYYKSIVMCEQIGVKPNLYYKNSVVDGVTQTGILTPISYVPNLNHCEIVSVETTGVNEEDTEHLRERYFLWVGNRGNDGTKVFYENLLFWNDDVGKYKVTPLWNGDNTVKLTILNSNQRAADSTLISNTQDYFDPPTATINDNTSAANYPQGRGMGNGQAPIGAIITVNSVTESSVVVNATVTLNQGYSTVDGIEDAVNDYIKSLALESNKVAYMPIWAVIYNHEVVRAVDSLTVTVGGTAINAQTDATLGTDVIPVLNTTNSSFTVTGA